MRAKRITFLREIFIKLYKVAVMLMIYFFELTIQWLLSHVFNSVEYQSELLLYK